MSKPTRSPEPKDLELSVLIAEYRLINDKLFEKKVKSLMRSILRNPQKKHLTIPSFCYPKSEGRGLPASGVDAPDSRHQEQSPADKARSSTASP